jgi:hypothetical protein
MTNPDWDCKPHNCQRGRNRLADEQTGITGVKETHKGQTEVVGKKLPTIARRHKASGLHPAAW